MAVTLPAASPSASPAPQSPQSSVDGSNGPATPVSPSTVQTLALPPPVDATPANANANASANGSSNASAPAAQPKRKPSRRANTAERRATHNAVERARRETLNGRFLDLAALLPNLSQIRRPSKSSIVNSSIAHIHASRRHRMLAARELRMLKLECDALRRELNEWRDRSGLPRVEEPVRGEGFQMIMSGEVEILSAGPIEEEDGDEYGNDGYGDDDFPVAAAPVVPGMPAEGEHMRNPSVGHHPFKGEGNPFTHNAPHGHPGLHLQTILPRPAQAAAANSPMIVQSPTNVSFENPAMASVYDPPHMQPYYMNGGVMGRHEPEGKWAPMYGHQQQQHHPHHPQQFTPPASSHGGMVPPSQYVLNMQRQGMYHGGQGGGHMYGSPIDNDDASSVGSAGHSPVPGGSSGGGAVQAKRERSGSMGSVGSNPSTPGSYEMPSVLGGGAGLTRRAATGSWDEGMGGMPGMGPIGGLGGMGMGGRGAQAAMTVGGGGGNAFGAMML